jgi:hypothetical protein
MLRIDIIEDNMDIRPGSNFRMLMNHLFGNQWKEYRIVWITEEPVYDGSIVLHNEYAPAAIKYNGDSEWWIHGQKVPCKTQNEFRSYMKNKAFW